MQHRIVSLNSIGGMCDECAAEMLHVQLSPESLIVDSFYRFSNPSASLLGVVNLVVVCSLKATL